MLILIKTKFFSQQLIPPSRPNVHAPPPLSPVVNNHQSGRSVAPGMPPNLFSMNSVPGHRGLFISSDRSSARIHLIVILFLSSM